MWNDWLIHCYWPIGVKIHSHWLITSKLWWKWILAKPRGFQRKWLAMIEQKRKEQEETLFIPAKYIRIKVKFLMCNVQHCFDKNCKKQHKSSLWQATNGVSSNYSISLRFFVLKWEVHKRLKCEHIVWHIVILNCLERGYGHWEESNYVPIQNYQLTYTLLWFSNLTHQQGPFIK